MKKVKIEKVVMKNEVKKSKISKKKKKKFSMKFFIRNEKEVRRNSESKWYWSVFWKVINVVMKTNEKWTLKKKYWKNMVSTPRTKMKNQELKWS